MSRIRRTKSPKRKTPKRKTVTKTKLKKDLDKWHSIYVRLRFSYEKGIGTCITCGKKYLWRKMQNGHFMSRRFYSVRWNLKNENLQCPYCNVLLSGRAYEYSIALDEKYGEGTSKELLDKSRELTKFSQEDYKRMIREAVDGVKELIKTKKKQEEYKFRFPNL